MRFGDGFLPLTGDAGCSSPVRARQLPTGNWRNLQQELGHDLDRLGWRGADDHGRYTGLLPRREPVANPLLRPDEGDRVDELVRNGGDRVALMPAEVEILDSLGLRLPAVAPRESV